MRNRHSPRVEGLEDRRLPATFVVTSTDDSGPGSLRQALLDTSGVAAAEAVTIDFAIGTGRQIIAPKSELPAVTHDNLTIDGTSQPGFDAADPRPLIVLNGYGTTPTPADGLRLMASGGVVRGLVVDHFDGAGIRIGGTGHGNLVAGNYLGIDPTGAYEAGNQAGGVVIQGSSADTIGGPAAVDRNVISGNGLTFVVFVTPGLLAPGSPTPAALPQADGITLLGSDGDTILGNLIGTDATGTYPVANGRNGITAADSAGTAIGGPSPGSRNVVSGNREAGIVVLSHAGRGDATIRGNAIGTDITGTSRVPNGYSGIALNGSSGDVIGGPGAGNLVAANGGNGIEVVGFAGRPSTGVVVAGNLVGVDASGVRSLGNALCGVVVVGASGVTVGGAATAAGNVIGGSNSGPGVVILGDSSRVADHDSVLGNHIGVDISGRFALANSFDGVAINGSSFDTVGGTAAGAANVIADNLGRGVSVVGGGSRGDAILSNRIFGNRYEPIDLGPFGRTPNDPADADAGPNGLQNTPALGTIDRPAAGTTETVHGTLDSLPNGVYTIQVFADSPFLYLLPLVASPSSLAIGPLFPQQSGARVLLGTATATTDAQGHADFLVVVPKSATTPDASGTLLSDQDRTLVATATDAAGDTSEFSDRLNETLTNPPPQV